jgi:lipoprotein NlpD
MSRTRLNTVGALALAAALLAAAGCSPRQSPDRASVEIRGSAPATAPAATSGAAPAAILSATPDASGIVNYDGYQAAVARSGDTVASVAQRVGLSASELGAYNGLAPTHPLRQGDELVLPQRPDGYSTGAAASTVPAYPDTGIQIARTDPATTRIEAAPLDNSGVAASPAASGGTGWSPDLAAAAIDRAVGLDAQGNLAAPLSATEPLPPDPQAPVTLASPQLRQYQTSGPEPLAPTPQSRPVETITTPAEPGIEGSAAIELAAPAPSAPEPAAVVVIVPQATVPQPVAPQPAAPQATVPQATVPQPVAPQATAPQPTAPQPVAPQPIAPRSTGNLRLIRPVSGPVVTRFDQGTGRGRNDGIDFASPSGSPVVAAADGEVALVSQSLGGLGTIVLVRHLDDYLTVYGRIERVTVRKGDIISRGQKIGVVSPSPQPRMHFEVRRGAESLDPEKFF